MGGNVTNAPVHLPSGVSLEGDAVNARVVYYGRIVPMDGSKVIDEGAMCVSSGVIKAVQPRSAPLPAGFGVGAATQIETGGTIFPGLIELHAHRPYNVLPMAVVDTRYSNRDQWRPSAANGWAASWWYNAVAGVPMDRLVAAGQDFLSTIATYVDTKTIVAGTTTTQLSAINYKAKDGTPNWVDLPSLVRTIESPEKLLPPAYSRVDDFDSAGGNNQASPLSYLGVKNKLESFAPGSCIVHLCEGFNLGVLPGLTGYPGIVPAHEHFEILSDGGNPVKWAMTDTFAGVHCLALTATDIAILAANKSAIVWSPLSNYVLYGQTTDIKDAKANNIIIGLGADWSVTGSKNLFGEMKVARAISDFSNLGFTDQDIVEMATINGARILHWEKYLGSITPEKIADFIVIDGTDGDPYYQLITSLETKITLVATQGNPVFGTQDLMKQCGATGELIIVGGAYRVLALRDQSVTFAEAAARLRGVLNSPAPPVFRPPITGVPTQVRPGDPVIVHGETLNPGVLSGIVGVEGQAFSSPVIESPKVSPEPPPLNPELYPRSWVLDPLTVADDGEFFLTLQQQTNLPHGLAAAIKALYVYR